MPRSKRLLWRIFPYHVLIVLLSFLTVIVYAFNTFRSQYIENSRGDLYAKAMLFNRILAAQSAFANPDRIDALCKEAGALVSARFTVILPSGEVIGDSVTDPALMGNHIDRPEIRTALGGKTGEITRFSFTLREPMMYVAVPLESEGKVIAAIRTSFSSNLLNRTLGSFFLHTFLGGLILVLLALSFSIILSLRLSATFREIRRGAARLSAGDPDYRIHIESFEEIESLAETMNSMADQLNHRIRTITAQRNELEAVLSGMTEAVVAIDSDERIINMNHAAESLFGVSRETARGRTIQETIRNSRIQNFIKKALASSSPLPEETIIQLPPERFLQANGSPLRDPENRTIGALVVLNDITRLKTLENIRRDFVANVSHELKTPITSIKGFVETLHDGALNDPVSANRFLDIILKHTDRLNAIIDDLLCLSRIEQGTETDVMPFQTVPAAGIIRNVLQFCEMKAREKNIAMESSCSDTINLTGNPALLEQAVVNLVENAIKYSDAGSSVSLKVAQDGNAVSVAVEDHGIGIPEKHLPRIFERFYRVDKARSRNLGGTGLGLAIVKHIVQAHNGTVAVASTPGKGSIFTLRFPAAR